MVAFAMVVNHKVRKAATEVPFTQWNQTIQHSSLIERTNRSAYALARSV